MTVWLLVDDSSLEHCFTTRTAYTC